MRSNTINNNRLIKSAICLIAFTISFSCTKGNSDKRNSEQKERIFEGYAEFMRKTEKPENFSKLPPLSKAACLGELDKAEELIKSGVDLNAVDENNKTALIYAVECSGTEMLVDHFSDSEKEIIQRIRANKMKIARLLVLKGADVTIKDNTGSNALLSLLACKGPNDLVELLKEKSPEKKIANAMVDNAREGRIDELKALIENGGDVNEEDIYGATPLLVAFGTGNIEIIELIINSGADVNKITSGYTPLILAVASREIEMIKLLLSKGTNVNLKTNIGTPLQWAISSGNKEIVKLLIDNGADVNAINMTNRSELMYACEEGNKDIVSLLIDSGADTTVVHKPNGFTLIIVAAQNGKKDIIELLIKRGVKFDATIASNALCWAILENHIDTVKYLFSKSAKFNIKVRSCCIALDKFDDDVKYSEMAELLSKHNIDVNYRCKEK